MSWTQKGYGQYDSPNVFNKQFLFLGWVGAKTRACSVTFGNQRRLGGFWKGKVVDGIGHSPKKIINLNNSRPMGNAWYGGQWAGVPRPLREAEGDLQ